MKLWKRVGILVLAVFAVLSMISAQADAMVYNDFIFRVSDTVLGGDVYAQIDIYVGGVKRLTVDANTDVGAALDSMLDSIDGSSFTTCTAKLQVPAGYSCVEPEKTFYRKNSTDDGLQFKIMKTYDLTVTIQDSFGNRLPRKAFTIKTPSTPVTYTTDGNGQFVLRGIVGHVTATAEAANEFGTTVSGSALMKQTQSITLTVPVQQKVRLPLKSQAASGAPITTATVKVGDTTLKHVGGNVYEGLVNRTGNSDSFGVSIAANGYHSVTDTIRVDSSQFYKSYNLQLQGMALTDGSGAALGSAASMSTGSSYVWQVKPETIPEGASYRISSDALGSHVNLSWDEGGKKWTLTPKLATASPLSVKVECLLNNQVVSTKDISLTVEKGASPYPAAPSVTGSFMDSNTVTITLPGDRKLAQKLTVTATGGENGLNVSKTITDLSAGSFTMNLGSGIIRGDVTFSFAYESDAVTYTGSGPAAVTKTFYQLVSKRSLAQSVYEYTGGEIRPTVSGEEIEGLSYGTFINDNGDFPISVPTNLSPAPIKMTVDNDFTFDPLGIYTATYNDCPYGVTVRLKPYYTVGPSSFDSSVYLDYYILFYTVGQRSLTVVPEEQNIPYTSAPENKLAAENLLSGHSVSGQVVVNESDRSVLEVVPGSVKIRDGKGADVSRYYNVSCGSGSVTYIPSTPVIGIDESKYNLSYTYGDTVNAPTEEAVSVTGAYFEDVQFKWTHVETGRTQSWSKGAPKNAGTYTVVAYTEENDRTHYAEDSVTITIAPKTLKVGTLSGEKQYDGAGANGALAYNLEFIGLVPGDNLAMGTDYTVRNLTVKDETERYDVGSYGLSADITLMNTAVARNYTLDNGTGFAGTAQITARPIADAAIAPIQAKTYTGNPIAPDIQATYNGMTLLKDVDYRLTYENYVNAGTATVTVTGMGNYHGQTKVSFQILPWALEEDWLKLSGDSTFVYNGGMQVPGVGVRRGTNIAVLLNPGTDYTVTYTDSKGNAAMEPTAADTYTLTVTGKGNYQGELTAEFVINRKPLTLKAKDQVITYGDKLAQDLNQVSAAGETALAAGDAISAVALGTQDKNVTEKGSIAISAVTILDGETDVTACYDLKTEAGVLTIQPLAVTGENAAITCGTLIYNGAEQTLGADKVTLTVTTEAYGEETLTAKDFTLTGNTGTKVGSYTLIAILKGNFTGEIAGEWKIDPNLDAIKDLTTENVNSDHKEAIESLKESLQELENVEDVPQEWTDAAEKCEDLLEKLEDVESALEDLNPSDTDKADVKLTDKTALEQELAEFEAALENNESNLTQDEKAALETEITRIQDALEAIDNAQKVIDQVELLPDETDTEDTVNDDAIHAAKKDYDKLTDNEQKMVDDATEGKLGELYYALTDYRIVKGAGAKWIKGSDTGLSFTANGAFSKFESVKVDGKEIARDNYYLEEGSTIVTLKASYLKKLSLGSHTIQVVYEDGATNEAGFKIQAKTSSPATGDYIMGTVAVMALSGAALAVLLVLKKRKK